MDDVKEETRTVESLLTETRHTYIVPSVCRFLVPGIGSQEEFASWQLAWVRPAARESPRMGQQPALGNRNLGLPRARCPCMGAASFSPCRKWRVFRFVSARGFGGPVLPKGMHFLLCVGGATTPMFGEQHRPQRLSCFKVTLIQ